jgi:hypothetical protein
MFGHAGGAEIIDAAADGDDEYIVVDASRRHDLDTGLVMHGPDQYLLCASVESDHLAVSITEAVPVRLREVVELMHVEIDGSGCEFVQVRFPKVRATALDQDDLGAAFATELVAESGDELQAACATADDHDARNFLLRGHPDLPG